MRKPLFTLETIVREYYSIAGLAAILLAIGIWIVAPVIYPRYSC
jgi:hypothetical protein